MKFLFSAVVFLFSVELGLNLIAPITKILQEEHRTVLGVKPVYTIVVLGESTSTNEATQGGESWPKQLKRLLEKNSEHSFEIINLSVPGITTTGLLERLDKLQRKPQLLITMMGINDIKNFWYNEFSLIKHDDNFEFKLPKLLKIALNYQRFTWLKASPLDYPDIELLISKLKTFRVGSEDFENLIKDIDVFLESKRSIDKGRFNSYLGAALKPPWNPESDFEKSYVFFKRAVDNNIHMHSSFDLALLLAAMLNKKDDCKAMVNKAISENVKLSSIQLNRLVLCLPREKSYVQSVMKSQNSNFYYDESPELPIFKNHEIIYRQASTSKFCWIAMEYPRQPFKAAITELSRNADARIFFPLLNIDNFEDELKKTSYEEIFIDRFRSNFGHMTPRGAALIAENVYKKIKELEAGKLCGL